MMGSTSRTPPCPERTTPQMAAIKWTIDAAKSALDIAGFVVIALERTKDGYGTVLRCTDRALVTVYDSGKVLCQGKRIPETKVLFTGNADAPLKTVAPLKITPTQLEPARSENPLISSKGSSVRFIRDVPFGGPNDGVDLPW